MASGYTLILNLPPPPREPGARESHGGAWLPPQSGLWTHTHTHIPTPAKFSLHVWKVKPGVIVSLLI